MKTNEQKNIVMNSTKNSLTTRFFYKNALYKNVEAELCRKFRNVSKFKSTSKSSTKLCGNIGFLH